MKTTYNKLIRDKIPEIITANGQKPAVSTLNDDDYKLALLDKLVEEAQELKESNGDIGERADVAEVLRAIDKAYAMPDDEIQRVVKEKRKERGAFERRLYLKSVE